MNEFKEEKAQAKQALLDEYFGLGNNGYPQENVKLEKRFRAFIKAYGNDTQVLEAMALNTADKNFRAVDRFATFSPKAAPVLQRLAEADTWDLTDMRILCRYLVFSTDPVQTVALAERTFQWLDSHCAHEPFYRGAQLALHTNLTANFLKLHLLKLNNPKQPVDLKKQFFFHADAVLSAPDLAQFPLFHGIVSIRKGLLDDHSHLVKQGFELLKSVVGGESIFLMELEEENYESTVYGRVGETTLKITMGKRIRDHRKNKDLTIEELAELIELSPASMSEVERGVTGPTAVKFYRIAKELQVPAGFLMGLPESPELTPKQAQIMELLLLLDERDTEVTLSTLKILVKHANKKNKKE